MTTAGGGNYYYPSTTWGNTSTGITISSGTVGYPVLTSAPPPKKKTPLEWLEDEIERVCAMTRPGLVAA